MGCNSRRLPTQLFLLGTALTCTVTLMLSLRPLMGPKITHDMEGPPIRKIVYRLVKGYNETLHQVLPNVTALQKMTWPDLASVYHRYIENIQILCGRMVRLGNLKDGGWETCDDVTYRPRRPCLIYSFGIKNDFSFDDEAWKYYGCHIHSFDPSTKMKDHQRSPNVTFHATGLADFDGYWNNWRMRKLKTIVEELGQDMKEVSILKMDIEEWEWKCLPDMLMSGAMDDVTQLLVEFHITINSQPRRARYLNALLTLRQLYSAGFRIFYTRRNLHCAFRQIFDGSQKAGCHEVHMVRIKSAPSNTNKLDMYSN